MSDKDGTAPEAPDAKITTDGHGRTVWADTVGTARFELVTTAELRALLDSDDTDSHEAIAEAAASENDGVLARNAETGMFQIIDDDELRALLDNDFSLPEKTRPADVTLEPVATHDASGEELSLVSTQALRKIIDPDAGEEQESVDEADPGGGFDPYNSS